MEKEIAFKTQEEIKKAFEEMKEIVNVTLDNFIVKFTEKGNKSAGKEARATLMELSRDYIKTLRESIQFVKNNMPKKN